MPNLGGLSATDLDHVEVAADLLLAMHERFEILDPELAVKLSTLVADVHAAKEDQERARRRSKPDRM
ncbi:MAG: hypothetical protein JO345_14230 [Streptosporangiaceae bacterium]|nr:hypothetical protein [Streptosporangiaceae bacterium]